MWLIGKGFRCVQVREFPGWDRRWGRGDWGFRLAGLDTFRRADRVRPTAGRDRRRYRADRVRPTFGETLEFLQGEAIAARGGIHAALETGEIVPAAAVPGLVGPDAASIVL